MYPISKTLCKFFLYEGFGKLKMRYKNCQKWRSIGDELFFAVTWMAWINICCSKTNFKYTKSATDYRQKDQTQVLVQAYGVDPTAPNSSMTTKTHKQWAFGIREFAKCWWVGTKMVPRNLPASQPASQPGCSSGNANSKSTKTNVVCILIRLHQV